MSRCLSRVGSVVCSSPNGCHLLAALERTRWMLLVFASREMGALQRERTPISKYLLPFSMRATMTRKILFPLGKEFGRPGSKFFLVRKDLRGFKYQ